MFLAAAMPSILATGVSWYPPVTSPAAYIFSTLVSIISFTLMVLSLFSSTISSAISLLGILPVAKNGVPSSSSPFSIKTLFLKASEIVVFSIIFTSGINFFKMYLFAFSSISFRNVDLAMTFTSLPNVE